MTALRQYPSQDTLNSIFDYIDGKLFYKDNHKPVRFAGKEAGRIQKAVYKEYRQVKIKGRSYYTHRVVWIMKNGDIPVGLFIDHINGCGLDNRIDNLRLITQIGNNRNKRRSSRGSSSGYTGVTFDKSKGKWKAHIQVLGKHINLGLFSLKEDAYKARLSANEVYGFESTHGMISDIVMED